MRESSQLVRIEKHRVQDELVVLTFSPGGAEAIGTTPTADGPLVFVQHGLGSRKERHLDLCLRLAEVGFTACSLDARYHGDRATREMRQRLADVKSVEFLEAFAATVAGTVEDIAAAATYFGTRSYAVIGHSMGGFIALQTTLADPRVTSVVSIAGALVLEPPPGASYPAAVAEALRQGDPTARAAEFWPRPVLLLHGTDDETVPLMGSVRLRNALAPIYAANPERLRLVEYPGAGHELTTEMAEAAVGWTRQQVGAVEASTG
ncbi:MAG: alpha/beta fold hydrolase [Armatimonadota bacterium]